MSDMARLAQLAANPQGTTREEIYLAVASLYRVQGGYLNKRERSLMTDILRRLTHDVEMAIRIALAERLAEDASAPHDLILLLVDDAIEVARPLILRSPLLTDEDALRLIAEASISHHEAVAERPNIGEQVTDALVKTGEESVLVKLVRNVTARLSSATYETLVAKSRQIAALQEPLSKRPDLPPILAAQMCEWVSDALRTYITRNYQVAPGRLTEAVNAAATVVAREPVQSKSTPAESAQKLIDKLAASGQLKAGFLLRVLHQGQIDLFDLALARLVELPVLELRRRFYEGGPRAVALACRAVGIDRCVFATVYSLSRKARGLPVFVPQGELAAVEAIFKENSRPAALEALQAA